MITEMLPDLIASSCRRKGDGELLVDRNVRLTGRDAWQEITSMAGGLTGAGLRAGDRVAFLTGPSVRHAVTVFACLLIGAVPCALHLRATEAEIKETIAFLDPSMVVVDEAGQTPMASGDGTSRLILALDNAANGIAGYADYLKSDQMPLQHEPQPDDLALLILSSGTTGEPKAIQHTHRTLHANALAGPSVYGAIASSDRVIAVMAPSFAAWIFTVLPVLAAQATIVFDHWMGPGAFLDRLSGERITHVPLVPTLWRMLLGEADIGDAATTVEAGFFSGEPGSKSLIEGIATRFGARVNTAYLASEIACACGIVADDKLLLQPGKDRSTGCPVPGADLRIVDPEQDGLVGKPDGEIGEIAITGPSLSPGYWRDPDRTRKAFVDGWWRSGDLGWIDTDGHLHVAGRLDNRINSGGIKVSAEEVEAALLTHPGITQAAVVGEPDPQWGQRIVAHLVGTDPAPSGAAVMEFLREHGSLPANKMPKEISFHEELPTGPTGKILRRTLRTTRQMGLSS